MRALYLSLLISFGVAAVPYAEREYPNMHIEKVTSVYDGDTFRANFYNLPPIVGDDMSVRVWGVDTPEIKGSCVKEKLLAKRARNFTANFLDTTETIEIRNVHRGKYFRVVGEPFVGERSLTVELLLAGYAVAYDGGTKIKDWCE